MSGKSYQHCGNKWLNVVNILYIYKKIKRN